MAETKTKRNRRQSKKRGDFHIRSQPIVRGAERGPSSDVAGRMVLPRVYDRPILFVIAQDQHTIFVSWNIDWRCVFEKEMPADRQVYLRVANNDGLDQQRIAVEPMAAMHYVTISGQHDSCCVEIGYYQPADTWHSLAISDKVELPPQRSAEIAAADLATIPFHLSFQKLVDLLNLTNGEPLATALWRLEDRIVAFAERDVDLAPADREILRGLNMSIDNLWDGCVGFSARPNELQLGKRAKAVLSLGATSPTSGFGASS